MIRILFRASSYVEWGADAQYAARLAMCLDAELTGLYVVPVASTPSSAGGGLPATSYLAMVDAECSDARAAAPRFVSFAHSLGATAVQWTVAQGDPVAEAAYAAVTHDFVVSELESRGSPNAIGAAALVLHAHRPVIFVPHSYYVEFDRIRTVAFGWNGTAEALRALYDAKAIVARAERLVIFEGKRRPMGVNQLPFDPAAWGRGLGVDVRTVAIPHRSDVGPALLHESAVAGADLLVLGAYGRSRFKEWLLGGVSEFMVRASSLPVLTAH